MTWQRTPVAQALAALLSGALEAAELEATVFVAPPFTLNANSIVIGRPTEVLYTGHEGGFGVDQATLPVMAIGGQDQDDTVAAMLALVRSSVDASLNLGGIVQEIHAWRERGWRHVNVSGADLLVAEIQLQVLM